MFIVPITRTARSIDRLAGEAPTTPSLDVSESERGWTATLDLPGVAKEDVKISVEGRRVSVLATPKVADTPKEGDRIVWRERSPSRYARSFVLPVEVEQAETRAKLENGVLTLVLPRRADKAPSQIAVS